MKTKVLAIAVGIVVLASGLAFAGVMGWRMLFGPSTDNAIELVPRNSFAYGNVFLDPSSDQKQAIRDLLERFPQAPTPDEARNRFTDYLDEGLAEIDATFEDDIQPWLGSQIAGFATAPDSAGEDPTGAALIASKDNDAAGAFIQKAVDKSGKEFQEKSYKDATYFLNGDSGAVGIVGNFVVFGGEKGFKQVVATEASGDSLADSERFADAEDHLTDDRLATFYFDAKPLAPFMHREGTAAITLGTDLSSAEPVAAALLVESDRVVAESTTKTPGGAASDLLDAAESPGLLTELPGDSWGALGLGNLGDVLNGLYDTVTRSFGQLGGSIEQEFKSQTGLDIRADVLDWIGDAGFFVRGTDLQGVGGGLVLESKDQATSAATIERVGKLLERKGVPVEPLALDGVSGFSVKDPSMPRPLNVVAGDRVVIAYGDDATRAALDSTDTLGDSAVFDEATAALGDGFTPSAFFDLGAIKTFATSMGATADPGFKQGVEPWLEPLNFVVFGSRTEDGRTTQRTVLGFR